MDSVPASKVLEDVSVISVKITFGVIQTKNAMVSHSVSCGCQSHHEIDKNLQQT